MKLGLGTVQFGQAYGVSNKHGQVPQDEARAILVRAAQAGVRVPVRSKASIELQSE